VKLSDDEIEDAFTRSATVVECYFTPSTVLRAFCLIESPNRVLKRCQLFIGSHNEPRSLAAMRVSNAPTPGSVTLFTPTALLIVPDYLRRGFAQFKLVAHFLEARSKRFNS
jgi:hypothetical protein